MEKLKQKKIAMGSKNINDGSKIHLWHVSEMVGWCKLERRGRGMESLIDIEDFPGRWGNHDDDDDDDGSGGGGGSGGGDINDDSHFYDEIVINGDGNFLSRQSLGFKKKPDMTSGRELFDTHHFSNINVHSKYPHDL